MINVNYDERLASRLDHVFDFLNHSNHFDNFKLRELIIQLCEIQQLAQVHDRLYRNARKLFI